MLGLVAQSAPVCCIGIREAISVRTPRRRGTDVECARFAYRGHSKAHGAMPGLSRRLGCSASGWRCHRLGGTASMAASPAKPILDHGNKAARPPVSCCAAHVLRHGTVVPCKERCQHDCGIRSDTGRKAHQRDPQRGLAQNVVQGSFCQLRRDAGRP